MITKPILFDMDIRNIFNNHKRSEWEEIFLDKCDIEIDPNDNHIIVKNYTESEDQTLVDNDLSFTLDELHCTRYPYNYGDIITHKELGGCYVIYDLPLFDERVDLSSYSDPGYEILYNIQHYKIQGYYSSQNEIAGYNLESYCGEKAISLGDRYCKWDNFEYFLLSTKSVFDLPKDNMLWKFILDYMTLEELQKRCERGV